MTCKPRIIRPGHTDDYQAWCPACGWESDTYAALSWAFAAADAHTQATALPDGPADG
jgi:hypothetical protein